MTAPTSDRESSHTTFSFLSTAYDTMYMDGAAEMSQANATPDTPTTTPPSIVDRVDKAADQVDLPDDARAYKKEADTALKAMLN